MTWANGVGGRKDAKIGDPLSLRTCQTRVLILHQRTTIEGARLLTSPKQRLRASVILRASDAPPNIHFARNISWPKINSRLNYHDGLTVNQCQRRSSWDSIV
ncbi:hypothetical protein AB1N83_012006 [Pleurotus pulmonarius]